MRLTVFITGACVLVLEVVAIRLLAPYFGNSIYVVTSVLTVILLGLSCGYYLGGWLADRWPWPEHFYSIILASGFSIILLRLVSLFLLPIAQHLLFPNIGLSVNTIAIFLLPSVLLGTLSPYAIKLESLASPESGIGIISGRIFFWSTLGSILGSILSGYYLIPHFGVNAIFIGVGALLCLLGLVPLTGSKLSKAKLLQTSATAVTLILLIVFAHSLLRLRVLFDREGFYSNILIFDSTYHGRPTRFIWLDLSRSGAMYLDTEDPFDMAFNFSKYFNLYRATRTDVGKALVIGGAAYTTPKALLSDLPLAEVDVVEIEPSHYTIAREYFALPDNRSVA
jgi:predicted membrane-bound spermidine synthase